MIHKYITPTENADEHGDFNDDHDDDYDILNEDGAGNVVTQRFRHLQSFVI